MSPSDRALMALPYEEWISLPAAARRTQLDGDATASIVRLGRRRGVLRTRGQGRTQQIRRIHPGPRRTAHRSQPQQR
ncbi:hypothetical protein ACWD4V_00705 [Streptomyces tsukubensis]